MIVKSYPKIREFDSYTDTFSSIKDIWEILDLLSEKRNSAIIRGINKNSENQNIRRLKVNFPEPKHGSEWVMLDVDGVEIPEDIANCSKEAIEYFIENHLPNEFRNTSYVFQFSNSAGILDENGKLLEDGLSVHLFFYLNKKLTHDQLRQWLSEYPVDKTLFREVQIHYIAFPSIGEGVKCIISNQDRQGIVKKKNDNVDVSNLNISPTKIIEKMKKRNSKSYNVSDIDKMNLLEKLDNIGCIYENSISETAVNIWHPGEKNSPGSWCIFFNNPNECYHPDGTRILLDDWLEKFWGRIPDENIEDNHVLPSSNSKCIPPFMGTMKLLKHIREFEKYKRNTVIKTPSGLGKSTRVINELFKKGNRIHYLVDSHKLGQEINSIIRSTNNNLNGIVFQGRDQEGMCKWNDKINKKNGNILKTLSKKNISIYSNLCHKSFKDSSGKMVNKYCDNYKTCPYLNQFRDQKLFDNGYDYVILTHNSLVNKEISNIDNLKFMKPDFVVVDETFWQKFHGECNISIGEIIEYSSKTDTNETEKTLLNVLIDCEVNGKPLLKQLRDNGISKDVLEQISNESKKKYRNYFAGNPDSSSTEIVGSLVTHPNFQQLYDCLLTEICLERDVCHSVENKIIKKVRNIQINSRKKLARYDDSAFLIIDADANDVLIEKVMGWSEDDYVFHEINVKRKSFVTQVHNKTFARRRFEKYGDGVNMGYVQNETVNRDISDLNEFIGKIASSHKKVLVIIYMDFENVITPLDNVEVIHWNGFRGMDKYKDYDVVVTVGRNEPPISGIESIARGIFFDDIKPITFLNEGDWCVKIQKSIRLKSGKVKRVEVTQHPDIRANIILDQIRECETVQGISRIRDIHGDGKKAYILCDVPLDLEVDRVVSWKDLKDGGSKPDRMFDSTDWNTDVLPLDPKYCLSKYGTIWDNETQFKNQISRFSAKTILDSVEQSLNNCNPLIIYNIVCLQLFEFRITKLAGARKKCISIFDKETTIKKLEEIYGEGTISSIKIKVTKELDSRYESQIEILNRVFIDKERIQNDLLKITIIENRYEGIYTDIDIFKEVA